MSDRNDLFSYSPAQGNLFGEGENRMQPSRKPIVPNAEMARERMLKVLTKARSAKKMPWSEHDVRMWQTVFPNMAKWLPEDEARQLCLEFNNEIERLSKAA